tara:strand:- start:1578 stop:1796 length:219 start_codon:yes stop_codon:yes gene_type:complete
MTTTKKDLIKRIVANRMAKLVESTPGIDYQKVLDNLYEEFGNKDIEDIVLYYNTVYSTEKDKVTVDKVSDLI